MPVETPGDVVLPRAAFQDLLEAAAEEGADRALAKIGLSGADAAADVQAMRGFLAIARSARSAAWQASVRFLVTLLLAAALAAVGVQNRWIRDALGLGS